MKTRDTLIESYNRLAEEYVKHYADELRGKPFDLALLERFAKDVPSGKRICDLGCGSGHVADHLKKLGVSLTRLRPEQAEYISVPVDGPYKPDFYRY